MKRLIIAEKPELARAIADALGGGVRRHGYLECGDDCVTWCFGHMLELLEPQDHDPRYAKWRMEDLPIVIPWKKRVSDDKREQYAIIAGLLKQASEVLHGGDPDAEGQMIVDEILAMEKCKLPVRRVLINDNTPAAVQRALANTRDNADFAGLSASALARAVGDLLYGVNMSRCYTLAATMAGAGTVMTVGRVQTPVLGLVVRRDREHAAHRKSRYFLLGADFVFNGVKFSGKYRVAPGDPVDEKGRLAEEAHAQALAARLTGRPAVVAMASTVPKENPPPLPFNLLKLQAEASRSLGLKPDRVKEITQTLREKHKAITYNRSDCQFLTDEHHREAPAVLAAIANNGAGAVAGMIAMVKGIDPARKSKAFDTAKVTAHHAIIPTAMSGDLREFSADEKAVYLLIVKFYLAQFAGNHRFEQSDLEITVQAAGEHAPAVFECRAIVTQEEGWRGLFGGVPPEPDLRGVATGAAGTCAKAIAKPMDDQPLPLYTMGTLLNDLTRVSKYVRDDALRKLLVDKDKDKAGEHGGIGTPATRDSIIQNLYTRGFLADQGKNVVSTPLAQQFYDALPDQAKFPDMTAVWHGQQEGIARGEHDLQAFIAALTANITDQINAVKRDGLSLGIAFTPCPTCGKALRKAKAKAKTKGDGKDRDFWTCTGYPACTFACDDKGGKPVLEKAARKPAGPVSALHLCDECGRGLQRRESVKNPGSYWWACSGFPACKKSYLEKDGKPAREPGGRAENQTNEKTT